MQHLFDTKAPKKPTNLSLNSDLVRVARELNINISAAIEANLAELVKERAKEQWLAENKNFIEQYNQNVEDNGVFSNGLRSF